MGADTMRNQGYWALLWSLLPIAPCRADVVCTIEGARYAAWKKETRKLMKQWTQHTLEHARRDVGVREVPSGSNDGPRVGQYLKNIGLGPGAPYCAAGVYTWSLEAASELGIKSPLPKTGYCPSVQRVAKALGILSTTPRAGSQFLLISSPEGYKRAAHTGLIEDVVKGKIITVEANTNLDGSREGNGVYRKERPFSARLLYIDWSNVAPEIAAIVSPLPVAPARQATGEQKTPAQGAPAVALAPGQSYRLLLSGRDIGIAPVWNGSALFPVREWCQKLGVSCAWNNELQLVEIGGKEAPVDIYKFGSLAYAPLRQLVKFSGLKLVVDAKTRVVRVSR